jgi:NitT/TauT family transport system permease protein
MTFPRQPRRWEKYVWPLFAGAVFLMVWHLAVRWSASTVFPSPIEVQNGLAELLGRGVLWRYIGDSLQRVAIGFSLAAVLGIPIGLALGWYPALGQTVNPAVQMLRPISPIAWIPVAIVWFGVGDASAVYLVFLAAFFPILVGAMNGVRDVPSIFRRAGRNFGLNPTRLLATIILPVALPRILINLRLALGIAWLVIVAAEMVAIDSGLGYLVIDSRNSGKRYDLVVAAMLMIGGIGLALDRGIRRLETLKSVRWGFRHEG